MLEIITIEREIINTPTEINEIGIFKISYNERRSNPIFI